jgi:formylglycine-generating enzyme required for sulfatase activity
MKAIKFTLLFVLALSIPATASAAGAMLRITCEGDDVGAEVTINGKFRGECPVDIKVPAGKLKIRLKKSVDATHEGVFEQNIRMADDSTKNVDVVLTTRLTAAAQKLENKRLAALRAQAAKARAEFDAEVAHGTIQTAFRDCPDCPEMVAIPPGSFDMGSTNGDSDEKPQHRVSIAQAFALGKTEVTQGQWKAIMGSNPSRFTQCGDNCPVERVSWNDAQEFIRKLNAQTGKQYRLPSEAEWEYACRAGQQTKYCGSDDLGSVAWYGAYADPVGNSAKSTNPVASRQANAWGLYDMSGNVWEWVEDSHHDSYNGAPADGSAWQGDGAKRVLRGGSWLNIPQFARAACRFRNEPAIRLDGIGFRLARMLP